MAIVMITHDLGVVAELADDVIVMYGGKVVEQANVDDLFVAPEMPYTWGLLGSLPRLNAEGSRLEQIPGQPPSLLNPPQGCPFNPRCAYLMDVCRTDLPDAAAVEPRQGALLPLPSRRRDPYAHVEPEARGVRHHQGCRRVTSELLRVEGLEKHFPVRRGLIFQKEVGSVKAVDGVDFVLNKGETLGVVGESGCGKSTMARCVARLLEPTGGQDHLRRAGHHHPRPGADAPDPPRDDDGVPGPVRLAQPAQARRLHRRRTARGAQGRHRARSDCGASRSSSRSSVSTRSTTTAFRTSSPAGSGSASASRGRSPSTRS